MTRRLLALLLSLGSLAGFFLAPRLAHATGSVSLSTREPQEVDGKWKLVMTIDYGSVPHLPHIPMLVVFTPTVHWDLSLTDKSPEKPVLLKIPLQNQQPINEGLDVGFADASGKVFKITKFDFVIRRDHGFEAGEYDLKIKREDDGVQLGQTLKLTLKGDNVVVDRRAITFAGDKPKHKKDEKKDDGNADKKEADKDAPKENETPLENAEPNPADAPAPPPVAPKQGGCGCVVAGDTPAPGGAAALAALAIGAVVSRSRNRRTRRAA
jgi:MYXO-CTERM domain-containing protein